MSDFLERVRGLIDALDKAEEEGRWKPNGEDSGDLLYIAGEANRLEILDGEIERARDLQHQAENAAARAISAMAHAIAKAAARRNIGRVPTDGERGTTVAEFLGSHGPRAFRTRQLLVA